MPGQVLEPEPTPAPAPIKVTDAPVVPATPPAFNPDAVLPDSLPEELASLKGKTFKDLFASHQSLRKTLGERADKITALEAEKTALQAKVPKEGEQTPAPQTEIVGTDVWLAIRDEYLETGEVPEEALTAIEKSGVLVDRATALRFLEWQKFEHGNMAKKLSLHTKGETSEEQAVEIMRWLRSGQSPFRQSALEGFDDLSNEENLSWFDTVVAKFHEAVQAGAVHPGAGRFAGPRVSGRPVATPDDGAFESAADFQAQLLAVRSDAKLSPFERRQKEASLIARRKRQHGET